MAGAHVEDGDVWTHDVLHRLMFGPRTDYTYHSHALQRQPELTATRKQVQAHNVSKT